MRSKNYFSTFKTKGRQMLLLALMLSTSFIYAQDISTGLIAHFDFENISETSVPDLTGNWGGTLVGAPTVTTGQTGSAVNFPTVTDYMTLPEGVVSSLTDFSISTWVNVNTLNTWSRIFDFGTGTSNYMFLTPRAANASGKVRFAFKNGGGEQLIDGKSALPTGKWVHVAVTFSWDMATSIGIGKLYVDGSLVGTNAAMTINPSLLPITTQNYIAKSQWPDPTLDGSIDEFRIYNKTLTNSDILVLNGYPSAFISDFTDLSLAGDLENVTGNLTLPTTIGTNGTTIRWKSTLSSVVDTLGNVTRPDLFDATVKLTATLTQVSGDVTYTLTKEFTVIVKALSIADDILANWDFHQDSIYDKNGVTMVKSSSALGYQGAVMNDASIRTIGSTTKYNVLYTGEGKGYFDMGTEIGKAIYALTDYTISGFFRIDDDYIELNNNGNFFYNFSNSEDIVTNRNGYIIGSLKSLTHHITPGWYQGDKSLGARSNAPIDGDWHHIAFVQSGNTGTYYFDGNKVAENVDMTFLPSTTLPIEGNLGTPYNWLGRSCYPLDSYLKKTMIYGFQLLKVSLTIDDLQNGFGDFADIYTTLEALNSAYLENPNYLLPELSTEAENLTLGDLSNVTENLTLPTKGSLDNSILISWKSDNDSVINGNGIVKRQNYYNYNVMLTATLSKNGQKVTKQFPATVKLNDGTQFTKNLLVKFDFNTVTDSVVTDAAEMKLSGVLKNNAKVHGIGNTEKYNVLNLGDSIGYFDMGVEVGKIMYNLSDYTISAFYRVDSTYKDLGKNGNFLLTFSNSLNAGADKNGYLFASLKDQSVNITPMFYTVESGNQFISFAQQAAQDGWHHIAFTQSGTNATLYIDGSAMQMGDITNKPSTVFPKANSNRVGVPYNWIGRSCFAPDNYLRNTLVYDVRIYDKALSEVEIADSELNVMNLIPALDAAFNETPAASLKSISESPYKIFPTANGFRIDGLSGSEKLYLFDIAGRNLKVSANSQVEVKPGIYIVRINSFVSKVVVR